MSQITSISRERHAGKKWRRFSSYQFAATAALAPLVDAELLSAAIAMPLAFIQKEGGFALVAVLSLTPGRNMLVEPDGRWLGSYVPAHFRAYPFRYFSREGLAGGAVGIDEGSGLVVEGDSPGEDFFGPDGRLSPALQKVVDFLSEVDRSRKTTDAAVSVLAEAGVIQPWSIALKTKEGDQTIAGLHRVNETALNGLGDDTFLKLRRTSALPMAYSQILSMGTLGIFERLARLQAQLTPKPPATLPESLDGLFGIQSDDTIKF